jgi:hypothetical protein
VVLLDRLANIEFLRVAKRRREYQTAGKRGSGNDRTHVHVYVLLSERRPTDSSRFTPGMHRPTCIRLMHLSNSRNAARDIAA